MISRDIAIITEPRKLSLSGVPNFVQFERKPATRVLLRLSITVNVTSLPGSVEALTEIRIASPEGNVYTIKGTTDASKVSAGAYYYVTTNAADNAENLRQCLLGVEWFRANFNAVIPFGQNANGRTIHISSKGAGTDYNMNLTAPGNAGDSAYTINRITLTSSNNDSISGEASTAVIALDVYDGQAQDAQDDPTTPEAVGRYLTTLSKTYSGSPVWFDLNALFSQYGGYNLPPGVPGWFDAGTLRTFRVLAKTVGVNSSYFYASGLLSVLYGSGRPSDQADMSGYIVPEVGGVRLLTNKPRTPYVRGQKEYLNTVFPRIDRQDVHVRYYAYSNSGSELGARFDHYSPGVGLASTCVLNIDALLDEFPAAGRVDVLLGLGMRGISNRLEYEVLPECLHKVQQFTFLNRLGGWDAFNFDADVKDEIKPKIETYVKPVTPQHRKGGSVETVYDNTLQNTFTIEGAPVSDEVAEWLKELAASRVVLDNDGNYVIIEDFTLVKSAENFNMQVPTIKYRLSDV